jgi:hypothetical protein
MIIMINKLFENEEALIENVECDIDNLITLDDYKNFSEKYKEYANYYVEHNKILRESNIIKDFSNLSLSELTKLTDKLVKDHLLETLIMTNINDYRTTIGLPILK